MRHSSLFIILLMLTACSDKNSEHATETKDEHQDNKHKSMSMTAAHWNAPESESTRSNPVKYDQSSIARGLAHYQRNCAACHGERAMGDGPAGLALTPKPANLAQMSGKHPDGGFAWKISTGRGAMPPWKSVMSENEIWDVVNYIQSLATNNPVKSESENHNDVH